MTLSANRLAAGRTTTNPGGNVLYTCPTGRRAIVRDIRVEKNSGVLGEISVAASCEPPAGALTTLRIEAGAAAGDFISLEDGFIVLNGGDFIRTFHTSGDLDYLISGHEFVLP